MYQYLNLFKISHRIWLMAIIPILSLAAVNIYDAYQLSDRLYAEKQTKTQHLVEVVYGILEYFHAQRQRGKLTEQEAQTAALDLIKQLRYAGREYFWLNDMRPYMIIHPYQPELEGKDLSQVKDPAGVATEVVLVPGLQHLILDALEQALVLGQTEHEVHAVGFAPRHQLVTADEEDRVVYRERLANDLQLVLGGLEPYRDTIEGLVVESTYNWYWLVDGLMDAGYRVHLAYTAAIVQQSGLKYADDDSAARWLATLLRLGVLPEGYIYPKTERPIRDLLRKRSQMVHQRTSNLQSPQADEIRSNSIFSAMVISCIPETS